MSAYYNEHDRFAAAWLRELISRNLIAPGDVDERSIVDVQASDLTGYDQCHFFAGIGVWSYALRCASWPDSRPVWTGSCPCQPFSAAGARKGTGDERHLWPAWFRLIHECRPVAIFGEQVGGRGGEAWLDHVRADLDGAGYVAGVLGLPACGFGAPHIRARLFFVADRDERRSQVFEAEGWLHGDGSRRHDADRCGEPGGVADAGPRRERERLDVGDAARGDEEEAPEREWLRDDAGDGGLMGDFNGAGHALGARVGGNDGPSPKQAPGQATVENGPINGFWRDAEWIACRDGKARPVEPGTSPLAHGAPARVGRLRGYGNAIVAPVAEAFVRAYLGVTS